MTKLKVGIHVSKTSPFHDRKYPTLYEAIKEENKILKTKTAQIFTHGPRNLKKNNINVDEILNLNQDILVHGSYIIIGLWNHPNDEKYYTYLEEQIHVANAIKASGIVLHIDKFSDNIKSILKKIETRFKDILLPECPLLLEPVARKSSTLTFEINDNLEKLCDILKELNIPIGLCLDTAHIWSGGVDLQNNTTLEYSDNVLSWVKLWHLNGAKKENFGTGKDYHLIPFEKHDNIFTKMDNKILQQIILHSKKNHISIICEVKRGEFKDVKNAINILQNS